MKHFYTQIQAVALAFFAICTFASSSLAQITITEWDFEGDVITPSTGSGTASLLGTTATFAAGNPGRGWNTAGYPTQGLASGERGVQFAVSTAGFENIQLSYDQRASGTASRWLQVDYSLDGGSTWTVGFWNNAGGLTPHDGFISFNVDFSLVSGANENENFVIRIVTIFSPLAFNQNASLSYGADEAYMRANGSVTNGAQYTPTLGTGTGNYGGAGTMRFDNVNFSGDPLGAPGCTNDNACNYDPSATVDDNSCLIIGESCNDGDPLTFNDEITANCICEGQSASFDPHVVADSPYTLTEWASSEPSGNYPASMRFFWSEDPGSVEYNRHSDGAAEYDCSYAITSRPRINGKGNDGFSFINTGSPQFNNCSNITNGADEDRYVGSAVLRVNTVGLSYARAEWTARTVLRNNRDYAIRLQYRLGDSGDYTDFGDETEYSAIGTSNGSAQNLTFDLPAVVLDEANVYLRWVYYQLPGSIGGTRPELGLDNIVVTALGCTDPTACNYNTDVLADDGSCYFQCNDTPAGATQVTATQLGNCQSITEDLDNALTNVGGAFNASGGDLWYRFTAVTSGVRVEVITADFDALVELRNSNLGFVAGADDAGINSGEVINFGGLTAGDDYFIRVASADLATGSREFDICVQFLPDTRCDYAANVTTSTRTLCQNAKAKFVAGGSNYIFHFTPQDGGATITYETGAAFTIAPLQNVPGLLWNTAYDVAIDVALSLENSVGNPEQIVVESSSVCELVISPAPTAVLRASDNETNAGPLQLGRFIAAVPFICTTTEWEWLFTNTDGSQLPITHFSGAPSRFLRLLDVDGLESGAVYDVQVRPVFATGAPAQFGAVDQIAIIGALGLETDVVSPVVNDESTERSNEMFDAGFALYPNPNRGDFMNVNITGIEQGVDRVWVDIYDMMGKRVTSEQLAVGGSSLNIVMPLNGLAGGMYVVNIIMDGKVYTERMVVQK